ncbi:MAG: hypothetical protein AVO33_07565 [delta proteobacterium ML8_F1]|nr:MAG: hypothetical protein AVO33_07565 [delta proteobacterium ML8_F1]
MRDFQEVFEQFEGTGKSFFSAGRRQPSALTGIFKPISPKVMGCWQAAVLWFIIAFFSAFEQQEIRWQEVENGS